MNHLLHLSNGSSISDLKLAMQQSIESGDLIKADHPLDHYFAQGLYGRRIYVPAGYTVVTKVHLQQHITVSLKGTCIVVDEHGTKKEISSPNVWVTEPGTQRAVYCCDDVEWLTVHSVNTNDVEQLEYNLVCDDMQEYENRKDYLLVLQETGITELQARAISEIESDQLYVNFDLENVEIKNSRLQGNGVFAIKSLNENEKIAIARDKNGMRTLAGRYTNHAKYPNAKFVANNLGIDLYALRPIKEGEEITVNYRDALSVNRMIGSSL